MKSSVFYIYLAFLFVGSSYSQELDQLDILFDFLLQQGTGAKVGFLSPSNYISVKRKLPTNVRPLYIANEHELTEMVLNGSIPAALVSGLPEQKYHDQLHIFSSTIVTLHSILMAPDYSTDTPHGVMDDLSTYDLSLAINAAISKLQLKELDLQVAANNAPKEIILAHTCKEDDQSQFPVPNRSQAKGVLRNILDEKVIKVLANGPYNWGDNDGNYLVDPPVGFYPDILEAIIDEFRNLSGPDGEKYGDIQTERFSTVASPFPWFMLFDGSAHITEPYFILDAPYGGSGKSCTNESECLKANLPGEREKCNGRWCSHPNRPRIMMLRTSCTVLGTDSKFFTKRSVPLVTSSTPESSTYETLQETSSKIANNAGNNSVATGITIGLLSVLVICLAVGITFMIFKERRGSPIFKRLY